LLRTEAAEHLSGSPGSLVAGLCLLSAPALIGSERISPVCV
jgi:hypothetical protein